MRDVIAPDAPDGELRDAFRLALGTATHRRTVLDRRPEPRAARAKLVTVVCPKGGAGKTTVASNLAAGLARLAPGKVALVDLDLQFGDVASALHLAPEHTMRDIAQAPRLGTTAQGAPHAARGRPVRARRADRRWMPTTWRPSTSNTLQLLTGVVRVRRRRHLIGLDGAALVALEASTDLILLSAPTCRACEAHASWSTHSGSSTPPCNVGTSCSTAPTRTGLGVSDIEATVGLRRRRDPTRPWRSP